MKPISLHSAALAVLVASGPSIAQTEPVTAEGGERLSYTYIQAGYAYDTRLEPALGNAPESDGDGYGVQASFDVTPTLHLLGEFNQAALENPDSASEQDLQRIRAGLGLHSKSGANANNSYFLNLTYERYDFDGRAEAADGYGAELGWRHGFTTGWLSRLELDLSLQLIDLDESALLDNDVTFRAQLLYDLSQRFALFANYEDNQVLKDPQVGLRVYF